MGKRHLWYTPSNLGVPYFQTDESFVEGESMVNRRTFDALPVTKWRCKKINRALCVRVEIHFG